MQGRESLPTASASHQPPRPRISSESASPVAVLLPDHHLDFDLFLPHLAPTSTLTTRLSHDQAAGAHGSARPATPVSTPGPRPRPRRPPALPSPFTQPRAKRSQRGCQSPDHSLTGEVTCTDSVMWAILAQEISQEMRQESVQEMVSRGVPPVRFGRQQLRRAVASVYCSDRRPGRTQSGPRGSGDALPACAVIDRTAG